MLNLKTYTLGLFQVHNYLLWDSESKEAVLIDTGNSPEAILTTIQQEGLDLKLLLYTHAHLDHIEGHGTIRAAYPDLPAWIYPEEQFWIEALPMQAQMFGMQTPEPPTITGFVQPGQKFTLSHFSLEARFCPGHTPGGISYYVPDGPFLFTGDTLFAGTIGRTDFPKGDYETLMQSIMTQILPLPDETILYPGHGEASTIGQERRSNPFILSYTQDTC
jgi:hydroxyacylglutathione hydrolase